MIDLSDIQWEQCKANYTNGATVARLLKQAYADAPVDHWYDALFQELCHQYTVSESAYLAAPHLVHLARTKLHLRKSLLILLGACHAFSDHAVADNNSLETQVNWVQSAQEAVPLILDMLAERQPSSADLLYLLVSLAACSGYPDLARALESLDYELT